MRKTVLQTSLIVFLYMLSVATLVVIFGDCGLAPIVLLGLIATAVQAFLARRIIRRMEFVQNHRGKYDPVPLYKNIGELIFVLFLSFWGGIISFFMGILVCSAFKINLGDWVWSFFAIGVVGVFYIAKLLR